MHAHAPVAELVARALDHDRPVVRHCLRRGRLVGDVLEQVLGGEPIEIVIAHEAVDRRGRRQAAQLPDQPPDREAQLARSRRAVGLPERHLARLARRRRDEHPVVRDLLDTPARGAEHERLAHARFEDHLLVELAHPRGAFRGAGQEHAVQAAVGNRARVGDGDALGAFPRREQARDAVPGEAGTQLGELVGRVAARQHVEHALEHAPAERLERRGRAHAREQAIDGPWLHRDHGHDLLCQHVERIARVARRLDATLVHGARHRRACEQIAAVLREDHALARGANVVAGAADALHAARDRRRRFDLHDEVDRAHVDPELERRGRDERAQLAGLEGVLDLDPLLARDRSVVRAHERLAGELVQGAGEPLRQAPAVDEQQRRLVRP